MASGAPKQAVDMGALVDAHYGALHRLARLVGCDDADADRILRAAFARARQSTSVPDGDGARPVLLAYALAAMGPLARPEVLPPVAPAGDFEEDGSRWEGWWKDDLPDTPVPTDDELQAAVRSLDPAVAAVLVIHDVEGFDVATTAALLAQPAERTLALLQTARAAVRTALRTGTGSRM
jgi:DNA-directed RNA polymerase specialized sigma24 family protein